MQHSAGVLNKQESVLALWKIKKRETQRTKALSYRIFCKLTGLWVAVAGVVVALAGPTAGVAEVEETRVAVITLGPVHSCLTCAGP